MNVIGSSSTRLKLVQTLRSPGSDERSAGRRFTVAARHLSFSDFMLSKLGRQRPSLLNVLSMVRSGPRREPDRHQERRPLVAKAGSRVIHIQDALNRRKESNTETSPPVAHDRQTRLLPALFGLEGGAVLERPDLKGVVRLLQHKQDSMLAVQQEGNGPYRVLELKKHPDTGEVSTRQVCLPFTEAHPACRMAVDWVDNVYVVCPDGKSLARHWTSLDGATHVVETVETPKQASEILAIVSSGATCHALVRLQGGETALFELCGGPFPPKKISPPAGLEMSSASLQAGGWGLKGRCVVLSGVVDGKPSSFYADRYNCWHPL